MTKDPLIKLLCDRQRRWGPLRYSLTGDVVYQTYPSGYLILPEGEVVSEGPEFERFFKDVSKAARKRKRE